jgi:hypothetical protein
MDEPRPHPARPRLIAGGTLVLITTMVALVTAGASSTPELTRNAAAADVRLAVALDKPLERADVDALLRLTRAALAQPLGPAPDASARRLTTARDRLLRAIGSVLRNPGSADLGRLADLERSAIAAADDYDSRALGDLGRFDTRELRRLSVRRRAGS